MEQGISFDFMLIFDIQLNAPLESLEWKVTFIPRPDKENLDQVLIVKTIGPLEAGLNTVKLEFVDPSDMSNTAIADLTCLVFSVSTEGVESVSTEGVESMRVVFILQNVVCDLEDGSRRKRIILPDPMVTRF